MFPTCREQTGCKITTFLRTLCSPDKEKVKENMNYKPEAANLLLRELSLAGFSQDDEQRLKKLEERRITPDKELPPVDFLFRR